MPSDETQPLESSTAPLPPSQPIPTQIGPYRILETLGEGGMGTVFKAEQRSPVKRIVALKLIKPGFDTAEVIARFQSERQALARMDHPHVAKVLDAGADDLGRPYFVMEYVPGTPITKFADDKKLSIPERLELFIQVCEAIAHAHTKAIIHRDIKSSNVLAYLSDNKPTAKVIDFGVAKALTGDRLTDRTFNTARGEAIGTYESMSPEQADGSPDIDTRTDVYSLGVLLYELLTGLKPFDKITFAQAADHEIRRIIREVEPPRPSTQLSYLGEAGSKIAADRRVELDALAKELRSELEWIPLMAMRKERDRRYASAPDLVADIRNYLESRPLRAGPESLGYRARKYLSRNKRPLIAAAAIVVLLVGGIAASTIFGVRAHRAEKTVAWQLEDVKIQRNKSMEANQRADEESKKLRRELSERYVDQGIAAWEKKSNAVAMLWFCEALQLDQGDPEREILQRIRIATSFNRETLTVMFNQTQWSISPRSMKLRIPNTKPTGTYPRRTLDGSWITEDPETVQNVDISAGEMQSLILHDEGVQLARFSADSTRVLTADPTGVRIWEAHTGKMIAHPIKFEESVYNQRNFVLDFSSDGKYALIIGRIEKAESVQVWDIDVGKRISAGMFHERAIQGGCFSPDGKFVVTTDDNAIRIWEAKTGIPRTRPIEASSVGSANFTSDGKYIVTGSSYGARVWDANSGIATTPHIKPEENTRIDHVAFSPSGDQILIACVNVHLWDLKTAKAAFAPMGYNDDGSRAYCAEFSPDGKYIVAGYANGTARLWDSANGNALAPPMDARVRYVSFSPDSRYVLTSGDAARLWSATTGKPVTPAIPHNPLQPTYLQKNHASLSPDGHFVLTLHALGTDAGELSPVRPTTLPVSALISLAQLLSGQRIDPIGGPVKLSEEELYKLFKDLTQELPGIVRPHPRPSSQEAPNAVAQKVAANSNELGEPPIKNAPTLSLGEQIIISSKLNTPINVGNAGDNERHGLLNAGTFSLKNNKFNKLELMPVETISSIARGDHVIQDFAVPAGGVMIQVTTQPAAGHAKWAWASKLDDFALVDSTGKRHPPVGAVARVTNEKSEQLLAVSFDSERPPISLPDPGDGFRPTQIILLYLVPKGIDLKSIDFKEQVIKPLKLKAE